MILAMESSRQPSTLGAGFDPRKKIYRDSFNELFVFVLSAVSASVIIPVILLIVGAFVGSIALVPFMAISIVLELVLIFGFARPQMKPRERVGWALLWGFSSAALAACFWELVFSNVI
jgi:hypothetical protein